MGMVIVKVKLKQTRDARCSRMVGDHNPLEFTTLGALDRVLKLMWMPRVA